jgi:aldehyde:ferredoxin oxidoreductase
MRTGYAGRLLHVDLGSGRINAEPLEQTLAADFIGGYGVASRLLYRLIPPHVEALGPDNILAIMTGPLTGSGVPTGTRWTVCCKSPLTGTWGDANGSGYFGPMLKASGYDGVLFSGISETPVYLLIEDGRALLLPAADLWSLDTYETDDLLKARHGKNSESVCIGPAGEKLSLISGVVHAKGRIAARSGVGAVMGSKLLKAVVAKGSARPVFARPDDIKQLRQKYTRQILDGVGFSEYYRVTGTPGYIVAGVKEGDSAIRNWGGIPDDFPEVQRIGASALFRLGRKKRSCWQCPIGCWGEVPLNNGTIHIPEYETASAFGSNLLMSSLKGLLACTDVCNRYGLDTISTGVTLALAIECFEAGLIDEKDTGGLTLRWGYADSIIELICQLAERIGFGAVLTDGAQRAATQIGQGAEQYAMHISGQELPMHDPRYEPGMGLVYVADATPGRHGQASQYLPPVGFDLESYPGFGKERAKQQGRGRFMKPLACLDHVVNASGLCLFGYLSMTVDLLPEWLTAVTGTTYDLASLLEVGERIAVVRQAFNVREGINMLEFEIPERAYGIPPLQAGPGKDIAVDIRALLREHLEEMGWDQQTAKPDPARLASLRLRDIGSSPIFPVKAAA